MIMPSGHGRLLLPVRPTFIVWSLLVALLLRMGLVLAGGRAGVWLPDLLLITILYWTVVQPRYVGLGLAFAAGLCADVFHYSLLGQHALVYVTMAAATLYMQRRLQHFSDLEQAPQIAMIFFAGQLLLVLIGVISSHSWPGWLALLKPALELMLWPVIAWVLQMPQRMPVDPDLHRPL